MDEKEVANIDKEAAILAKKCVLMIGLIGWGEKWHFLQ